MASVPPVDAPIAITGLLRERSRGLRCGHGRACRDIQTVAPSAEPWLAAAARIFAASVFRKFAHRIGSARLGQHFHGAEFQRLQRGLAGWLGQRTDDDRRHGMKVHQLLQEGEPVHARHFDVQGQHVGLERKDLVAGHVRIGRGADHFDVRLSRQGLGQDLAHDGGIVDDQNAYFAATVHMDLPVTVAVRTPQLIGGDRCRFR